MRPSPSLRALAPLAFGLWTGLHPAPGSQEGAAEPPLSVRVNVAIERGVRNLLAAQGPDGAWRGDETRYPGGLTAFVAYTLIKSGVRRSDAAIGAALRALAEIPHRSTYGTSARLLLYQALGRPAAWRERAQPCLDALVDFQRAGLWGYPEDPIDLSNVQFALLGLRAAHDLGLDVPERALVDVAKASDRHFDGELGAYSYRPDTPATGGIDAAALGNAALLEGFAATHAAVGRALQKDAKDRARAHAFLVERWDPARNAWGPRAWTPAFHHAYLWAVQRYCELAELETLGDRDWYREGAEHLVATQHADGGWGEALHDTCFALLFLRRTTFSGGKELAELYDDVAADALDRPVPVALAADARWITAVLAAGPIRGDDGDSGLFDPPFRPERLRPRAGAKVARAEWEPLELKPDGWSHLEELTGRHDDACLWLVATELAVAGEAEVPALLWLALEDGWRVYLDGAEVSRGERVQAPIRPDVQVPVTLAPGVHELVVIVEDALGAAAFALRISAPDGRPLDAVTGGIAAGRKR
jgi:hypothetical protein